MKKIEFVNGQAPYLNEQNLNQMQQNMEDVSVPEGGTKGQVLLKASNTDNDVEWTSLIPSGGTKGQVLTKASASDNDFEWTTPVDGDDYVSKEEAGTIVERNYSVGTEAPTGGSDGDIYDQYFD